jgi:hypothetical protein
LGRRASPPLDLCNPCKRTTFNFDIHRQPHAYGLIVERRGQRLMADGTPVASGWNNLARIGAY